MKVIIIEDEAPAAKRLSKLLEEIDSDIEVTQVLDSVESSIRHLRGKPAVDLMFMDIQLADGISFDIFSEVPLTVPVIFTTAFDQYTLKAFKVNSIDYLLKPIDELELEKAIQKYRQLFEKKEAFVPDQFLHLLREIGGSKYKERLLIKRGQQLGFLKTEQTAYCFASGKLCYAFDFNNNKYLLEDNLSELELQLPPNQFYRINRHLLIHIDAIKKVHTWLGGRLKIETSIPTTADTTVSRDRVNGFKEWLGR